MAHRDMIIDGDLSSALAAYLPVPYNDRPFVTLTYAQLLDSRIAAQPGTRTVISHQQTKAMTHYIRHHHDAILVGIGTVLADDPKLNCRYYLATSSSSSIRPVVLDPHAKWRYSQSQLRSLVDAQQGLAPLILVDADTEPDTSESHLLQATGGHYIKIPVIGQPLQTVWNTIYKQLWDHHHIRSIMVEGGATVINDLLTLGNYDSLIVTIGPVFLGDKGVVVSPQRAIADLQAVQWWTGIQDSVLMARQSSTTLNKYRLINY
ncbi:2,5-diamino-6-(ribosylamino)-4(3H)-pyrimidinone 5'-phosphate reductase [Scheffersomyces spartinae]|uniref:2,5-diamino-6-ribosylamino-4(3H)-pyrimidinone 5'-phosphate reductase n=1 Tax=Scheffersomyces spartinae TaxID=45513 RepID=A0A9P7VA69_9ASCO|nr:2,5-diamino-6-(ribosylamino)-4(3H)-pyrimidinone 5'-phosphate reductase [Scheffersomyces spartinae]KAG7194045.1 2,5-diamino-6-(ribosylamino)-4(3H)-pyrimidinone 5'-phosphate reductase [Scheffersomyces spartinae]